MGWICSRVKWDFFFKKDWCSFHRLTPFAAWAKPSWLRMLGYISPSACVKWPRIWKWKRFQIFALGWCHKQIWVLFSWLILISSKPLMYLCPSSSVAREARSVHFVPPQMGSSPTVFLCLCPDGPELGSSSGSPFGHKTRHKPKPCLVPALSASSPAWVIYLVPGTCPSPVHNPGTKW